MVATNPESPTEKEKRLADSITSDPVFTVSKGSLTPAKHLQMGVGLKHITGGDKVGRIISSYGHSISTTQEKEIITEIGISILEKKSCLPEGILPEPGLATTCDFDNYDELTDSINLLKEATHDTNGIVIQNRKAEIPHSFPTPGPSTRATSRTSQETPEHQENPAASGPQSQQSEPEATHPAVRGRKRRRKFDNEEEQITPYKKIPKADQFPYKVFKSKRPKNLTKAQRLDNIWAFLSQVNKFNTPMWKGWNSQIVTDKLPVQNIGYQKSISASMTRRDVFIQLLQHNQKKTNTVMDKGQSRKSTGRLCPMTKLASVLGEKVYYNFAIELQFITILHYLLSICN